MGMDFRIAAPRTLQPDPALVAKCEQVVKQSEARVLITDDIAHAVDKVDFIYTDVWVSMGEPESVWKVRIKLLKPYQINQVVMEESRNPDVKFMHCLPAFHNRETKIGEEIHRKYGLNCMEVADEIYESEASIVFDQAENRMHTIKAVMVATLGE
jgi:ornithine carbamoyltransferase